MKNTNFFDFGKLNEYFTKNLGKDRKGRGLYLEQDVVCKSLSFCFIPTLCEFDYIKCLSSSSVTQGNYNYEKGIGIWEEFRINLKGPIFLKNNKIIPKGKYRIKVRQEADKKPIVQTFVPGLFGWKERSLPISLPLNEVLNENFE